MFFEHINICFEFLTRFFFVNVVDDRCGCACVCAFVVLSFAMEQNCDHYDHSFFSLYGN